MTAPPTVGVAPGSVLVLGGTAEGRELADALVAAGQETVSSLAGRVPDPKLPAGQVRVGGFGGPDGLARYLLEHQVARVVDATHPFAAEISRNAVLACAGTGTPLLVLRRPAWEPVDGDRWHRVPDLAAAAARLRTGWDDDARVFLTTGRQGARAFRDCPHRFWLRAVHPPAAADLPARCEVLLERGPFDLAAEREFLQQNRIDALVSKNSGGPMTSAKLTAARELGLPVLLVDRPPAAPGTRVVSDVPAALRWAGAVDRPGAGLARTAG